VFHSGCSTNQSELTSAPHTAPLLLLESSSGLLGVTTTTATPSHAMSASPLACSSVSCLPGDGNTSKRGGAGNRMAEGIDPHSSEEEPIRSKNASSVAKRRFAYPYLSSRLRRTAMHFLHDTSKEL